jgi:hypothetical protein
MKKSSLDLPIQLCIFRVSPNRRSYAPDDLSEAYAGSEGTVRQGNDRNEGSEVQGSIRVHASRYENGGLTMKLFLFIIGGWTILSVLFVVFLWPNIIERINTDYPLDSREVPVKLEEHFKGERDA